MTLPLGSDPGYLVYPQVITTKTIITMEDISGSKRVIAENEHVRPELTPLEQHIKLVQKSGDKMYKNAVQSLFTDELSFSNSFTSTLNYLRGELNFLTLDSDLLAIATIIFMLDDGINQVVKTKGNYQVNAETFKSIVGKTEPVLAKKKSAKLDKNPEVKFVVYRYIKLYVENVVEVRKL